MPAKIEADDSDSIAHGRIKRYLGENFPCVRDGFVARVDIPRETLLSLCESIAHAAWMEGHKRATEIAIECIQGSK